MIDPTPFSFWQLFMETLDHIYSYHPSGAFEGRIVFLLNLSPKNLVNLGERLALREHFVMTESNSGSLFRYSEVFKADFLHRGTATKELCFCNSIIKNAVGNVGCIFVI